MAICKSCGKKAPLGRKLCDECLGRDRKTYFCRVNKIRRELFGTPPISKRMKG